MKPSAHPEAGPEPAAPGRSLSGAPQREAGVFRLGVVDYLNMQPLIWGLEALEGRPAGAPSAATGSLELWHGPPSRLADWLESGEIEMGMVPTGALLRHPEWRVAGASMIGSRGPVLSVVVVGPGDPADWRVLRPDAQSTTSNALARVILERHMGLQLDRGEPVPMDGWVPADRLPPGEALVLIGSRALRWRRHWGPGVTVLDLGEAWTAWTRLPMVFALWVARPGATIGDWAARLEGHATLNQTRLPEIAQRWPRLAHEQMTAAEALNYFERHIDYGFDAAAHVGLQRFWTEGRALGLFDPAWELTQADR